jgi:hypothetical protein
LALEQHDAPGLVGIDGADPLARRCGRRLVVALLDRSERPRARQRGLEVRDAFGIGGSRMMELGDRRLVTSAC